MADGPQEWATLYNGIRNVQHALLDESMNIGGRRVARCGFRPRGVRDWREPIGDRCHQCVKLLTRDESRKSSDEILSTEATPPTS